MHSKLGGFQKHLRLGNYLRLPDLLLRRSVRAESFSEDAVWSASRDKRALGLHRAQMLGLVVSLAGCAYIAPHVPYMPRGDPITLASATLHAKRVSPVSMLGQPLTGSTLRAALKWRCDMTGAGYAIYWVAVNGKLVVAGDYTTDGRQADLLKKGIKGSFATQSENFEIEMLSDSSAVAKCFRTQQPVFLNDVASSDISRAALAEEYQISQIACAPFEDGVIEFGTSPQGSGTATWPSSYNLIPKMPALPKDEMRYAYEQLGASYTMLWALSSDKQEYTVRAEHVTTARRAALKQVRGDDKTFCSESRAFKIDAAGSGPIATAARTGEIIVVDDVRTMKRRALAEEFQISKVGHPRALLHCPSHVCRRQALCSPLLPAARAPHNGRRR